jgi:hypothetical protein
MRGVLPPFRTMVEKNILRRRPAREFSHSLGQTRHCDRAPTTSGLPLTTEHGEMRKRVRLVPHPEISERAKQ